jgi:hypothetical protein
VTAYVTGPEAARYQFTSALPVQVLKGLAPVLTPHFEWSQGKDVRPRSVVERGKEPALTPTKNPKTITSTQVKPKTAPGQSQNSRTLPLMAGSLKKDPATSGR